MDVRKTYEEACKMYRKTPAKIPTANTASKITWADDPCDDAGCWFAKGPLPSQKK